mmetsp:Transcript_14751/g.31818  ORF Transcript_14751/g.31818 Transcript_14751/m.31818 type:complete len:203 (+) Transcript_14751:1219-1827(+)
MSQSSRSCVDHNAYLPHSSNPHNLCCLGIINLIHHLNLCIMISCSQRSQLLQPSLLCPLRNTVRICSLHTTILFAVIFIFLPGISLLNSPINTIPQQLIQIVNTTRNPTGHTHSHRHIPKQSLSQLLSHTPFHILLRQVCSNQPHSTIDIKSHSPWANHCLWIVHIKRSYISYTKSIPRMNIWYSEACFHYPGESSHVGCSA